MKKTRFGAWLKQKTVPNSTSHFQSGSIRASIARFFSSAFRFSESFWYFCSISSMACWSRAMPSLMRFFRSSKVGLVTLVIGPLVTLLHYSTPVSKVM